MIERYDVPEVSAIWSDEARMRNWLEIELAAVEAWAVLGVVPKDDARACRDRASFDVDAVLERERVTRHDVAAFVDVVAASIGPEGRWIHHGLTSSDVFDTGLAMQLRASADVLLADLEAAARGRCGGARSSSATRCAWGAPTASTPSRRRSGTSSRCSRSSWTGTARGCAARATPSASARSAGSSARTRASTRRSSSSCASGSASSPPRPRPR